MQPGGCSAPWALPGLPAELEWLKKDLAANHSACTAAYWHQPTFSATNSISPEGVTAQAFWQLLYEYGADLVLNGDTTTSTPTTAPLMLPEITIQGRVSGNSSGHRR